MAPPVLVVREPSIQGSRSRYAARVVTAEFEGGYRQRATFGPNNVRRSEELTWEGLSNVEAAALIAFLAARGGSEAFFWTPPGEAAAVLWSCQEFERSEAGRNAATVTAAFTQEFDLV